MLFNIIKREIHDHLTSLRFALTLGLITVLMVLNALLFINGDYRMRLEEYAERTAAVDDAVRGYAVRLNDLAMTGPGDLYKKPSPFAFCAKGQEDVLPIRIQSWGLNFQVESSANHKYQWTYPWKLDYVQDKYRRNSMLQTFTTLDWSFIVGIVMSFVAILFTFDAVSRERERGTLALAFSNPVSRGTFLLGKFSGAFIAIAVPMLIGLLLNLLIVRFSGLVSFGADDWARVGLMGVVSLLYIAVFIGLGLAVSSRMANSSTSLLVLLTIWVALAVLAPSTLGSLVGMLRQVPADLGEQREAAVDQAYQNVSQNPDYMLEHGSPSDENPRIEALQRWAEYLNADRKTKARFDDMILDEQFAQVEFARNILRLSPTAIYQHAMQALAGTGFPRHKQFIKAARQFRQQFTTFLQETDSADLASPHVYYVKEGLSKKPVSFSAIPRFVEPGGVGVALGAALMDFSLLLVIAVFCFMASYVAFLKASVR